MSQLSSPTPADPGLLESSFCVSSLRAKAPPVPRSVLLACADESVRTRLRDVLTGLRWKVHVAEGGAAALMTIEEQRPEALLLGGWLPDLEVGEFAACVRSTYPQTDILRIDGQTLQSGTQSLRRQELQQVLRELSAEADRDLSPSPEAQPSTARSGLAESTGGRVTSSVERRPPVAPAASLQTANHNECLPEMVGASAGMRELGKLVRLVAPRSTTVLIEGETGTGKELVAKALHRLSARANKPFVVLNCAAIPEALLEAELFGHTRGAFTGAVRSRTGRIEAADGGTLFLDEIGELPLALQAKMLRFLECGELQRVGDNEPSHVDVRVIAATHRPLEQRAEEQAFRLDLYHRLAVFPIEVPSLRSRMEDLPLLAEHFLGLLGKGAVSEGLSVGAMDRLRAHHWPGNVRELMHVIERALILAGAANEIGEEEIRVRRRDRSA